MTRREEDSRTRARRSRGPVLAARVSPGLLVALGLLLAPLTLEAQEKQGFRFSPAVGVSFFPSSMPIMVNTAMGRLRFDTEFQTDVAQGLDLGYRISDRWGVELDLLHSNPDLEVTTGPLSLNAGSDRTGLLAGNVNRYFVTSGRLTPFVSGGLGAVFRGDLTEEVDPALNVGAGTAIRVTPWLDVRGTVRDYISRFDFFEGNPGSDSKVVNEVYFTVGLDLYP